VMTGPSATASVQSSGQAMSIVRTGGTRSCTPSACQPMAS
jgi:hypothetical protein